MYKSIFTFIGIMLFTVVPSYSQTDRFSYTEEKNIYRQTADVEVITSDGKYKLSEIYSRSPLLIALVFTRCSGICSPFLNNLSEEIRLLQSKKTFKILVLSFDPRDDLNDMKLLSRRYGLEANKQWIFGVSPQINVLDSSMAFYPIWDSVSRQFDHEALLTGINNDGYIVKKITGIRDNNTIAAMINEINNGFNLSYPLPENNKLFSCFTYDPVTGKKRLSFGLLLLVLPALIAFVLVLIFGKFKLKAIG